MVIKPNLLIILDGFGYSEKKKYNAIYLSKTKVTKWFNEYPSCLLKSSGTAVGLLDGMIGNSEVGHLTIGSGRIIKQPVSLLHDKILNESFFKNKKILNLLNILKERDGKLHLIGLLSDAGVHSNDEILFALIKLASYVGLKKVIIHAFTDGRDVPPKSAAVYFEKLEKIIKQYQLGTIGSIHGRFYAMDRDKNWIRTQKTYNVLTKNIEPHFYNWKQVLDHFYQENITDEFIPPTTISKNTHLKDGDGIIFFNIREDRARQLTQSLIDKKFDKFQIKNINLSWIITGIPYDPNFKVNAVLCSKKKVKETFFDVLEKANMRLFSIAETEKYAHITYFFNGGREIIRPNETRILIPSKSFKHTYEDIPEMSAPEITQSILSSLENDPQDFYLVNFANADMVAHSGNLEATIKALKILDECLTKIYDLVLNKLDGTIYITSDHGNAEYMYDINTKQFHTAHTCNKVPFIMLNNKNKIKQKLPLIGLSDIAPFILKNLNLPVPDIMKKS